VFIAFIQTARIMLLLQLLLLLLMMMMMLVRKNDVPTVGMSACNAADLCSISIVRS